jgi:hypothetical protein
VACGLSAKANIGIRIYPYTQLINHYAIDQHATRSDQSIGLAP